MGGNKADYEEQEEIMVEFIAGLIVGAFLIGVIAGGNK